jgi:adenosyl cobinamide kinase/adenosyl cobinamide phosphate guanylyltransferase
VLHLILGAPKSGKSEYAERLVAGYTEPTAYVGTLPLNPYYSDTIWQHRRRRPSSWGLIELVGEPRADLRALAGSLHCYRNVLLDGLLFYLLRLRVTYAGDLDAVEREIIALLIRISGEGEVVVVDPPAQDLPALKEHEAVQYMQSLLVSRADTVTFVEGGKIVQTLVGEFNQRGDAEVGPHCR